MTNIEFYKVEPKDLRRIVFYFHPETEEPMLSVQFKVRAANESFNKEFPGEKRVLSAEDKTLIKNLANKILNEINNELGLTDA